MTTITVSKKLIKEKQGVVILSLKEYHKLYEMAVPTYYLEGKEAEDLDKLVEEGINDYKEGKTISASSMEQALKIYGKRKNKKH